MMNKQEMLQAIEDAKYAHLDQMYKIESAINGKEVKKPPSLGKMYCDCGVWFHANEKIIQDILGMQLFERLDLYHEQWHHEYVHIYDIFFKNQKRGFFATITGKKSVSEMDLDKAKLYFKELQETTEELLKVTESAKRRISAVSESKFS